MLFNRYKKLSVLLFGSISDRYSYAFQPLRSQLRSAQMPILVKTWMSICFMTTMLTVIASLVAVQVINSYMPFIGIEYIYYTVFLPILVGSLTFLGLYMYPSQRANSLKKSIENNMPFALAHMSAIASAGIPPESMFQLLIGFKEYGEISNQAAMVVRNINTFGMSSVTAMKMVANRSPSKEFKQLLLGISSTIEKGGNLVGYLKEIADSSLFDYRIKREKYLKSLSTYADIYTALLVAAPLMMLSILGIMSIIGGNVMGLGISELMVLITWVALPGMNIAFLSFLHLTYPGL